MEGVGQWKCKEIRDLEADQVWDLRGSTSKVSQTPTVGDGVSGAMTMRIRSSGRSAMPAR